MAIMIREFVENGKSFATKVSDYQGGLDITEAAHAKSNVDAIAPDSLMVEIEGVHAVPFITRNFTRYTQKCLKESVPTWTNPYRRPLLKHHNEENGEPIGRVVDAEFVSRNTRSGTPALKFTVNVPDAAAKEGIKNGLLSTVSIGVIAHDVRCSICGSPIVDAEEGCPEGHKRGVPYETAKGNQEICCWDIHKMEAKELSYVDVPSDMYAKNVDYYPAQEQSRKAPQLHESLDKNIPTKGEQHMPEDKNTAVELEEAKAKVSELETKVTELTEAKAASEGKVTELTESVEKLTAQVTELTEAKTALEAEAKEAAQLKESMEQELADSKVALKEAMADMYITLRESMGNKVENADAIKERPIESLKYSILDMKESLASTRVEEKHEPVAPAAAGSVQDPTLPVDVKESHESDNEVIDLKAGLLDILNSSMNAYK